MADDIVQLPSDGTGKKLDTESLTVGANTVHRERNQIAGATDVAIAVVTNTTPGGSDYGLVVRPTGSPTVVLSTLKYQTNFGTTITWQDSGGDEVITLQNLAFGVGRNGAIHDWGAAPRPTRYRIKATFQFETAPAVGETIEVWIREAGNGSSATDPTNDDGTGDIALSQITDKTRNLKLVLVVQADEAVANIVTSREDEFETTARHFGPVVVNRSAGDNLENTANVSYVEIQPVFQQLVA